MAPTFPRSLFAACALLFAGIAGAAPLPAFVAHYRLLQDGSPVGEATLTLAPADDGNWRFTTDSKGTSGMAAMLGASVSETSLFRWKGDLPEGLSYDYSMDTAFKRKQRHVRFDWATNTIEVDDKGQHAFPAQPGALERHTTVLAIAAGLRDGRQSFDLPVAVRDRIETQHFIVRGRQQLHVPAGDFDAAHVARADGGGFEAWFAPDKLPVPVQVAQDDSSKLTMQLESYQAQ